MTATDVAEIHHPSRPVIGVVGLGAMGGSIAGRLLSQGNRVYGTNRTKAKADPLIDRGLRWCDTPRQVAEAADVIISMVTDSDALQAVTGGPDGILAGLRPGKVYLDMSTISPASSRELAGRVAASGAAMLAAPVSGSVPAVADGSLAVIVGGDPDAYPRVDRSCGSSAAPSLSSATTSTPCCSNWPSTSASPHKCSPSAKASCSLNTAASTRRWPPA